ncbi:MAG: UbiX family flavin prenyltransferase [Planctomycetota bacterium]|nr:UbiX family flavin prenyltransferase [Planctomycetota bacterium]
MPDDTRTHRAPPPRPFVLGISGASGAVYSLRLLDLLLRNGHDVHLVVSDYGRRLLFDEAGIKNLTPEELLGGRATAQGSSSDLRNSGTPELPSLRNSGTSELPSGTLFIHPNKDVGALIASGSFLHGGMVILPCSSATLGAVATGSGSNLLCRAAAVTLKERRPLIVCHREMPLSLIDIRNMESLALAGATICSPNPGFYLHPTRIEDIVDFVVGKVLDHLGVSHALKTRWEDHTRRD